MELQVSGPGLPQKRNSKMVISGSNFVVVTILKHSIIQEASHLAMNAVKHKWVVASDLPLTYNNYIVSEGDYRYCPKRLNFVSDLHL
jgi:hypothetical protein